MDTTSKDLRYTSHSERNELVLQGVVHGKKAFAGPEHVVIDLTNRCNNNCIACWTKSPLLTEGPEGEWHKQQLKTEVALQFIDELASLGTNIVRFTGGGEPFLHPHIYDLIGRVKSHDMFCAVTTSLNMVREHEVERLIKSGVDELSVSLWAADAEDYIKTHPNKTEKTFVRITQVLEEIGKRKSRGWRLPFLKRQTLPRINILNVISRLNCSHVEEMYEYALRVKADSIYFAVVDTIPGSTDSLLLSEKDRHEVSLACERIERKNEDLPQKKKIDLDNFSGFRDRLLAHGAETGEYDEGLIDSIPCYIGWIFIRVMANGEVVPCCRGVHFPMGNINETSFKEIWFSKKYNGFRWLAKSESKQHRFFKDFGCGKTCDNFMHNLELHNRLF